MTRYFVPHCFDVHWNTPPLNWQNCLLYVWMFLESHFTLSPWSKNNNSLFIWKAFQSKEERCFPLEYLFSFEAVIFKLGTRNVYHKRNRMTAVMLWNKTKLIIYLFLNLSVIFWCISLSLHVRIAKYPTVVFFFAVLGKCWLQHMLNLEWSIGELS